MFKNTKSSSKIISSWIAIPFLALSLTSCGGGGGGDSASTTTSSTLVNSAQSFSDAISFAGGQKISDAITAPGTPTGGFLNLTSELAVTSGGTSSLTVTPNVPDGSFVNAYLIKLSGATETFVIPADANGQPFSKSTFLSIDELEKSSNNQSVSFASTPSTPVSLNCTATEGLTLEGATFSAEATVQAYITNTQPSTQPTFTAADFDTSNASFWTTPETVSFKAVTAGEGQVQVTLTWNNDADVDLYLVEPDQNEIFFGNSTSTSGGFLDIDDTDGFGPENVFFESGTPAGTYAVEVDLFSLNTDPAPVTYNVTVKVNGTTQTFEGSLTTESFGNAPVPVTTFTIN